MEDRNVTIRIAPTFELQVSEFNKTFGVTMSDKPGWPERQETILALMLIREEYNELCDAVLKQDLVETADAICDLHYVLTGLSLRMGLPETRLFEEVHLSNMSKANPDGTVSRRADGKILKSSLFTKPNLELIIEEATS